MHRYKWNLASVRRGVSTIWNPQIIDALANKRANIWFTLVSELIAIGGGYRGYKKTCPYIRLWSGPHLLNVFNFMKKLKRNHNAFHE